MTIRPAPNLVEFIGSAAEVAHGGCMNLPPVRKQFSPSPPSPSPNWQRFGLLAACLLDMGWQANHGGTYSHMLYTTPTNALLHDTVKAPSQAKHHSCHHAPATGPITNNRQTQALQATPPAAIRRLQNYGRTLRDLAHVGPRRSVRRQRPLHTTNLCARGCADKEDPRSHRRRLTGPAHCPGT